MMAPPLSYELFKSNHTARLSIDRRKEGVTDRLRLHSIWRSGLFLLAAMHLSASDQLTVRDYENTQKSRGDVSLSSVVVKSSPVNDVIYEIRNSHIPGGVYINGLVTWRDCVYACVEPCAAADFDTNDRSCWHHYGLSACSIPTLYQRGVNHYRTLSCLTAPVVSSDRDNRGNQVYSPTTVFTRPISVPSLPFAPSRGTSHSSSSIQRVTQSTCGRPSFSPSGGRIIGGDESRPRSWPWQIALRNKNARSSRCAGSLIAPEWVLTTAHCVDQDMVPGNWLVLSGAHDLLSVESNRVAHSIEEIIIHEHFNLDTFDNDIALLKLNAPIQWGPGVSPVCLPSPDYEFQGGYQCIITGWGVATNGRRPLKQAGIPVVPMDTCRRRDWLGSEFTLTERMICAGYEHGGVDTCQGDSGGPLVCFVNNRWVQAGITSFGRGCGLPQKPGVYAKVSKFIGWIQGVTNRYQ